MDHGSEYGSTNDAHQLGEAAPFLTCMGGEQIVESKGRELLPLDDFCYAKNRRNSKPIACEEDNISRRTVGWVAIGCLLVFGLSTWFDGPALADIQGRAQAQSIVNVDEYPLELEGRSKRKSKKRLKKAVKWQAPEVLKRCEWIVNLTTDPANDDPTDKALESKYRAQSVDANVFYRATAKLFWLDLFQGQWWNNVTFGDLGIHEPAHHDGTALERKATWTWVTGDQHLSNFGAWRNRHGQVVFSVNDFDEAAIYDFHVDVLRIAVSICSHGVTNGIATRAVQKALHSFTDTYVETVVNYVGNEDALLYEVTPETATGVLQDFMTDVHEDNSSDKQLDRFTDIDASGTRRFIKDENSRLAAVGPAIEGKIRDAFASDKYGATLMKIGWHVREWDDDYFHVLDIAARLGSGVGSYGVDRYYILLQGTDGLLQENGEDGNAVILDVKFEPEPAVSRILDTDDAAWYDVMFPNEAARAVEAQRRLTSYTDPFTGWIHLDGQAFVVRQRSPWKDSPDLSDLTDIDDFVSFIEQIAVATATSHVRGTVAKSPGQFKQVIASVLGESSNRRAWGKAVAHFALKYREQVLLDFECFHEFVNATYGPPPSSNGDGD